MLSTPRIAAAAREVLEASGEDFTMSMLAQRLGVAPSSLYNHVGSRSEVLALVSDHVVSGIDTSGLRGLAEHPATATAPAWREATEAWARSYVQAFAAQPAVVSALALTPIAEAPQTLRMYEEVSRGFLAAGWPEELVLSAIAALEAFLLGSALDAAAPADIFDPGQRAEDFPALAHLHGLRRNATGQQSAAQAFGIGLAAVLDGLQGQLAHHQST